MTAVGQTRKYSLGADVFRFTPRKRTSDVRAGMSVACHVSNLPPSLLLDFGKTPKAPGARQLTCVICGERPRSGTANVNRARISLTEWSLVSAWRKATSKESFVADLPDHANKPGNGLLETEFLLIKDLRDRPDLPLRWAFDDAADKNIGVVVSRQRGFCVEVNRSPIAALRDNAGPADANAAVAGAVWQEHAEFGRDAWPGFILKTARHRLLSLATCDAHGTIVGPFGGSLSLPIQLIEPSPSRPKSNFWRSSLWARRRFER